jgi:hypothetical protein
MKLLTEAQRAKLIENGRRQAAVKGTAGELDLWPVVKLFNPCGAATWLLTELDTDDLTVAWGLCDLGISRIRHRQPRRARRLSRSFRARHRTRSALRGARSDLGLYQSRVKGRDYRRGR